MKIKVAFYKGASNANGSFFSKLISFWTKSKYTHTELILSDGYMYSSSYVENCVRKKKHKFNTEKWDYLNIEISNEKNILEFFEMTKGSKYDKIGILGFIIPLKDRTKEWFCSEWVSNALKISSIKELFNQEPSKISPGKLFKILNNKEKNYE